MMFLQFKTPFVRQLFRDANGTFMTVTFKKKDGTLRTLNCRTGVRKYVIGTGKPRFEFSTITVWSPKDGYRTIRLDSVQRVTYAGRTVVV